MGDYCEFSTLTAQGFSLSVSIYTLDAEFTTALSILRRLG